MAVGGYGLIEPTQEGKGGFFPLVPSAGFAVLCGRPALALAAAACMLRRRRMSLALRAGRGSHRAWAETIHAEWTKLQPLASTGWLLADAVALTVTVSAVVPAGDPRAELLLEIT